MFLQKIQVKDNISLVLTNIVVVWTKKRLFQNALSGINLITFCHSLN